MQKHAISRPLFAVATILTLAATGARKPLPAQAAEATFIPLSMNQGDSESRTGMWFCPDLGKAADILPLKTRIWATKESVTGGVAMKCVFEKVTSQILLVSSTPAGDLPRKSAAITKVMKELVAEEKVAAADITRLGCYRGEAFAWAWLANEGHPAYMGHIIMAEMIAPCLTHKDRRSPE